MATANNTRLCSVENCDKPIKRAGFCYGHYMKNWRYGTPTPVHTPWRVNLTGKQFGTLTVESFEDGKWICKCDCGRVRVAAAGDLNREGDRSTCGDRTVHQRRGDAGYGAAHQRIYKDRGKATDYDCVDCGDDARQWSYGHSDPNEKFDAEMDLPYSLDPDHYSPRCVPCHKALDLAIIRNARIVPPVEDALTLF